jgi:hypothetical protein
MEQARVLSILVAFPCLGTFAPPGMAQSAGSQGSSPDNYASHLSLSTHAHLDLTYKRLTQKTKICNYFFDAIAAENSAREFINGVPHKLFSQVDRPGSPGTASAQSASSRRGEQANL